MGNHLHIIIFIYFFIFFLQMERPSPHAREPIDLFVEVMLQREKADQCHPVTSPDPRHVINPPVPATSSDYRHVNTVTEYG